MTDARHGRLILASTSPYRRELLSRLRLPFEAIAPDYREEAPEGLPPAEEARRHALGKARAVAARHPGAWVIGSDQVAQMAGRESERLGKPGGFEAARDQLRRLSGRAVDFLTGVALLQEGRERSHVEVFRVVFRELSDADIETYLNADRPWDCAGSFKSEGLGICLLDRMEGRDPTALVGLPLITLCDWLAPLSRPDFGGNLA